MTIEEKAKAYDDALAIAKRIINNNCMEVEKLCLGCVFPQLAESRGLPRIMIANHAGDHFIYPDCREEFIRDMDSAICSGTDGEVRIVAPYTNLTKAEVAKRGAAAGVDFSLTYSCYKGREKHCGKCGTCMERKEAFKEAGIVDVTDYED